jgi:lipopolysaccharide export system permease protein
MRGTLGLLDRHIFRNVLFACIATVAFFTFIFTTGNALKDLLGRFFAGQMAPLKALELLFWLLPYAMTYALPIGVLCGVLLVLGRMSADSEITAMRAAGLSLARIARPIYVLGALGALAGLAVNLYLMPHARTRYKQELLNAVRHDPQTLLVPRTFIREFSDRIVYIGARDGDQLRDVWIWELDKQQRVVRFLRAETATIEIDEATNELIFTPQQVIAESRDDRQPENFAVAPSMAHSESLSIRYALEKLFGRQTARAKPEWLTLPVLRAEIASRSAPGPAETEPARLGRLTKLRMVLQEKFAMAVAVLAFVCIAVPLGIKVSRRETSANLGVAVALALAYYFLIVAVKWLDEFPQMRPDLLLWLPNVVFLALAFRLTRRLQQA